MGLVLLLATGELAPTNVLGFCVAASNAFGLIAGRFLTVSLLSGCWEPPLPIHMGYEHFL